MLQGYWYLAAGGLVALLLLTAAFIKICAVHTPTSNPHYNKIDRENEQIQSLVKKKNRIVVCINLILPVHTGAFPVIATGVGRYHSPLLYIFLSSCFTSFSLTEQNDGGNEGGG